MLLKRGMGNGEWGMGNGEWGMGNGEWGMGNGEWGMGNGEWGMGNGEWGKPFLSAVNWLTSGFAYATLSFNRLTRCLQNRFISNYFMLFAFSSTVKFSKIVFRCEISCKV